MLVIFPAALHVVVGVRVVAVSAEMLARLSMLRLLLLLLALLLRCWRGHVDVESVVVAVVVVVVVGVIVEMLAYLLSVLFAFSRYLSPFFNTAMPYFFFL